MAYQLAMVVFLAPYGIVAQPIHTAVLPRLAAEARQHDRAGLRASVRWAADAMVAADGAGRRCPHRARPLR